MAFGEGFANALASVLNARNAKSKSRSVASGGSNSSAKTYGSAASGLDYEFAQQQYANEMSMMQAQMQFNAEQAQIQRDWEERMANTSYQRGVKDLQAAGLNPILAAGGYGAAVPVGAAATSGLGAASKANAYPDSSSSGSSYEHSESRSKSEETTQLHELGNIVNDLKDVFTDNSAKEIKENVDYAQQHSYQNNDFNDGSHFRASKPKKDNYSS